MIALARVPDNGDITIARVDTGDVAAVVNTAVDDVDSDDGDIIV